MNEYLFHSYHSKWTFVEILHLRHFLFFQFQLIRVPRLTGYFQTVVKCIIYAVQESWCRFYVQSMYRLKTPFMGCLTLKAPRK